LFLAGVGAGGYLAATLANYFVPNSGVFVRAGVILAFPLLAIGTIFLIMDLGVKLRALKVFLNPGTSWIARGSWIISIFMIFSFIHFVMMVYPGNTPVGDPMLKSLSAVNLVFSVLVMIYTGVLLGASRAIAFWNTAMLPLLFLLSASSTGIFAVLLLTPAQELHWALSFFGRLDLLLLMLETIVVIFYLQAAHRTDEARASVQLLLRGRLAAMFWLGLIVLGLAIPLALETVSFLGKMEVGSSIWIIRTASVSGLIGGLILRRLVLAAGVRTPLRAGGIEFTFPSPVRR
jgi:formate-dependent nitrite reductase membrane component NrfD